MVSCPAPTKPPSSCASPARRIVLGTGNLSTGRLENWYFRTTIARSAPLSRIHPRAHRRLQDDAGAHRGRLCNEHLRVPGGVAGSRTAEAACLVRRRRGRGLHAAAGDPTSGRPDAAPAPARSEPPMPEICKEDSASFNAEGCRAIAEVVGAEMMGKAVLGLQHSNDPVLPTAQLDELAALCLSSTARRSAPTLPRRCGVVGACCGP